MHPTSASSLEIKDQSSITLYFWRYSCLVTKIWVPLSRLLKNGVLYVMPGRALVVQDLQLLCKAVGSVSFVCKVYRDFLMVQVSGVVFV